MSGVFERNGDGTHIIQSSSSTDYTLNGNGSALRLVLFTDTMAWARTGIGAQTATDADIPLARGENLLRIPLDHDHLALIGFNSAHISFMRGNAT